MPLLGVSLILATSTLFTVPPPPKPPIHALISQVAKEYKISSTTLYNLAKSESSLNPNAVGDHGCSYGLTQQNICANKGITKEEALDPEWNLTKAAKDIKKGKDYIYTSCNCYSFVSTQVPNLPRMAQIQPNTKAAPGTVAIFYYKSVKHVALVTSVNGANISIKEANYSPCKIGQRTISLYDKRLVGFWYA